MLKTFQQIWVDGGYKKGFVTWVLFWASGCVTVAKHSEVAKGFHVLPKRWIVEKKRTFGFRLAEWVMYGMFISPS